jgi:hypothetical protein
MNKKSKSISPQFLSERFGITIEENLHTVKAKQTGLPNLQLGDRNKLTSDFLINLYITLTPRWR